MRIGKLKAAILSTTASIFLVWPMSAQAFGPDGHDYIATVARDLLQARNPAAAARFQAILANNVLQFRGTSTEEDRHPVVCNGRTLREIASWPDCIRYTLERRNTSGYHFDDVPLYDNVPPPPPPASYCENGKCASLGLEHFISILSDENRPRPERAVALAWVIHIVGDLHQPLHTADNGNDRGGGLVSVRIAPRTFERSFSAKTLHSIWDTPIVYASVGEGPDAIATIRARVDAMSGNSSWARPVVHQWVVDSHAIAQRAYRGLNPVPPAGIGATRADRVAIGYFTPFRDDMRDQLAKASVRLARILETALS